MVSENELIKKVINNVDLLCIICNYINLYDILILSFVNKTFNIFVKENIEFIIKNNKKYYLDSNSIRKFFPEYKFCYFDSYLNIIKYKKFLHKHIYYNKEFMIIFQNIDREAPKLNYYRKFVRTHYILDKYKKNIDYCSKCKNNLCCFDKNLLLRNIFFNPKPYMSLSDYDNYTKKLLNN